MTSEKQEEVIREQLLFQGSVFSVRKLDIALENGEIVEWEIVEKGGDSVAMVPVDQDHSVHLIEEYYGAVDMRLLSLPKGTVEPNETPEMAAKRELQEEIGYTGKLTHLVSCEVSPSYLRQRTHIFLVTDLVASRLSGDEKAHIQEKVMSLDNIEDEILSGNVTEARTIAGLLLAKSFLRRNESI